MVVWQVLAYDGTTVFTMPALPWFGKAGPPRAGALRSNSSCSQRLPSLRFQAMREQKRPEGQPGEAGGALREGKPGFLGRVTEFFGIGRGVTIAAIAGICLIIAAAIFFF